jgi:DNA-binding CsgD family transcriptional regulator
VAHCVRPFFFYSASFLPMISTEELSELLATLYAAPLQPEKWQTFFDHLSRLTNISSGYLLTGSGSQPHEVLAGGGFSFNPEVLRLYNDYYGPMDPFAPPVIRNPRVAVIRGVELVRQDELLKTEFYNDLLSKHEMESMTLLSCSSNAEPTYSLPVWRRAQDGPMEEDSINLLRMLLPHAHAALQMRCRLQAADAPRLFSEVALDAMSVAAFLVNADGRVQHMNKLAAALVENAGGLRIDGALLGAVDPAESAQLRALISGAASAGKRGARSTPGGALNISRQDTQHPLHVAVLPVPEDGTTMVPGPCALVFASDPNAAFRSRAAILRMLFRLTATESRLADFLQEGLEVRAIADRLGITLETARFHLKRVFVKTGARRQSELMRLMLSLPGQ